MFRKTLLLLLTFTILLMPVASVLAQTPDESAAAAPPPCTEEQRRLLNNALVASNEVFFNALPWLENESLITNVQDFSAKLPDLEQIITAFQEERVPDMPDCADTFFIAPYQGVLYESLFSIMTLSVLSAYSTVYGSEDIGAQLMEAVTARQEFTRDLPDVPEFTEILKEGGLFPDGLPICGSDAAFVITHYDVPLVTYLGMYPDYESFMQTNTGDFETLLGFETFALEVFKMETDMCYESFPIEVLFQQLFLDTSIVVHLAQVVAFERAYGNADTVAALQQIVDERAARIEETLPLVMPSGQ